MNTRRSEGIERGTEGTPLRIRCDLLVRGASVMEEWDGIDT